MGPRRASTTSRPTAITASCRATTNRSLARPRSDGSIMAIMPILRRTLAYFCRPWMLGLLATALIAAGAWTWWEWPQQFRRRGEAELAARHYDKAREEFSRYLAYRPADARGRLLAARAARHLREYYEAYEHLRRCRDGGGDAEAVDVETALI